MKGKTRSKPRASKAKRRSRHPNPAYPPTGQMLNDIVETMAGMALVDMARKAGISPTKILLVIRALSGNKPPSASGGCACSGECPCHTGVQLLAVPCPPDCPSAGKRFDGCHRCDCPPLKPPPK